MNSTDLHPSVTRLPFTIAASDGEPIFCDARFLSDRDRPAPVVIFTHGFKGFKDWGSIPYICESFARRGFLTVSFNFSHNGVEGNSDEFTRLDKFARNTFSREVRELREVIENIVAGRIPERLRPDTARIALIGHSRGGAITLLAAAREPTVRAVAVWASVADLDRYTVAQKKRWREAGSFETKNTRTGQIMRLDIALLDDLEENTEALDVGRAAASLGRPLLILHGEQDLTVRIDNGERLAALGDPDRTAFERIPRTGHTFGAVHPFEGTTPALEFAIERTASFLQRAL